jgi:DNA invertase Pin-like site-specific DNA recombinase
MSKTYFGYTRVSTVKQGEGVSLEAQKDAIERYCDQHGLHISQWLEEKETAAKLGRPIFTDMIKRLHQKQADGVVMHKIDRSARNLRDWATVGDLQDAGIDVHFAAESVDFASRGGRLTADIQAVIAADFIRNLKTEIRKGVKGRLKQGLYPHKAPLGYLDTGRGNPKAIDPERAPFIKEMFELYETGQYSLETLTDEIYERGFRSKTNKKVHRSRIDRLLSNPFMVGNVLDRETGQIYAGQHDAIIPAALFNKVQDVKAGRHRKKKTKHNLFLRGLFKCEYCKNAMIGERQKGNVYYRCHTSSCPPNSIRETAVENMLIDTLAHSQVSKDALVKFADWSHDWLTRVSDVPNGGIHVVPISNITHQLEILTEKLLAGVVDDATYTASKRKLLLKRQELEEQRKKQGDRRQKRDQALKFLELMQNLAGLYEMAKQHEKRQMIELCFSNRTVQQKNADLTTHFWLNLDSKINAVSVCDDNDVANRTYPQLPEPVTECSKCAPINPKPAKRARNKTFCKDGLNCECDDNDVENRTCQHLRDQVIEDIIEVCSRPEVLELMSIYRLISTRCS